MSLRSPVEKPSCLRGEQWVHRRRSVRMRGSWWRGRGQDWVRPSERYVGQCLLDSYTIFPSWFTVLACRIDIWIVMWKACLSLGSPVFLSVLWGWHTREGFQLLPSRRHCVCAFNHPLRKHFIRNTVCLLYLHLCLRGFCRWVSWCGPLMIQWWESCCCCCCCRHIPFIFLLCRYAQYLCYSFIINVFSQWRPVCLLRTRPFEVPCIVLLCVCAIISSALNGC